MDFFEKYKEDMISYVKNTLNKYDVAENPRKRKIGYSRFEHIMRVYNWMKKLYEAYPEKEKVDIEALSIATIFHDIGYSNIEDRKKHAKNSEKYCREYLQAKQYPEEKVDFVCGIVSRHSDKETMHDDIPIELVLLMEADLLDDIGAQGLVMDVWVEVACEEKVTFESILDHMEKYTLKEMRENPMRTDEAKRIWDEKRRLAEEFVEVYRKDIEVK